MFCRSCVKAVSSIRPASLPLCVSVRRQEDVADLRRTARDPIDQPTLSGSDPLPTMPRGRGDQQPMRSAHTSASLLSRGHASKRGGSYRTVGDSAPEPRVPVRRYVDTFTYKEHWYDI
jgi:hypothetical protein